MSMMYQQVAFNGTVTSKYIFRVDTQTTIPCEEANPMYQEYLAWLAEGNEPLPPDQS